MSYLILHQRTHTSAALFSVDDVQGVSRGNLGSVVGVAKRMKFNFYYLTAFVSIAAAFFAGSIGIQLAVLGVTLAIFFGTLSLQTPAAADAPSTNSGT